jgi:hypothetical protein
MLGRIAAECTAGGGIARVQVAPALESSGGIQSAHHLVPTCSQGLLAPKAYFFGLAAC